MFVVLLARSAPAVDEAIDLFQSRVEFAFGMARGADEAAELVASAPESCVVVPLASAAPAEIRQVEALSSRRVAVVALAPGDDVAVRERAFAAGAVDVLVPPLDRARTLEALALAVGRPLRAMARAEVPFAAAIAVPGESERKGSVRNISRGGVALSVERTPPVGSVVRLSIDVPPPHRLPVLFARVISRETSEGAPTIRAAFVGVSREESARLEAFVQSIGLQIEDLGEALKSVRAFSLERLRRGLASGERLPALSPLELDALTGTGTSDLRQVAVARCRILMLSSVVDAARRMDETVPGNLLTLDEWWAEIQRSRDVVEILLERALAAGASQAKDLRELLSRVHSAILLLDRVSVTVTGRKLYRPPVVEEPMRGDTALSVRAVTGDEPPAGTVEGVRLSSEDTGTASRLLAIAEEAVAKARPAPATRRPISRRARIAIMVVLAAGAALGWRLWLRSARSGYPPVDAVALSPVLTSKAGIRVRSLYGDKPDHFVAVVDGSWFAASAEARRATDVELARHLAMRDHQILEVRDYSGRVVGGWLDKAP